MRIEKVYCFRFGGCYICLIGSFLSPTYLFLEICQERGRSFYDSSLWLEGMF